MNTVSASWSESRVLDTSLVFSEKRQKERRREGGSEDGGGRDKRVGSPRRLSLWVSSRFPGIFFGCLLAWLPRHA